MGWARAAAALVAFLVVGALLVSGGSGADPRTPPALPGLPAPFLGTAVLGNGGLTAGADAYGDVVDLRAGPTRRALVDNPSDRQAAGTVPAGTGIVPRVRIDGGPALPLWRAEGVKQLYLPGSNVLITVAEFPDARLVVKEAVNGAALAVEARAWPRGGHAAAPAIRLNLKGVRCLRQSRADSLSLTCGTAPAPPRRTAERVVEASAGADRRWLRRARPLGAGAPPWAVGMYGRSLLVLRALSDRGTGAVAAGARDGWAYVWPRDASAAALAFAAAGYRDEAERVARFLLGLNLDDAARFHGDGSPVADRAAQGDAIGWVAAAAEAAGVVESAEKIARVLPSTHPIPWRDRADYQEGEPGDYLGNALASAADGTKDLCRLHRSRRLVRRLGDRGSGLDSAAAWAVRPFPEPCLYPAVRATLRLLADREGRFGIAPSEDWPHEDPWSAPTAWTAWSLAALGERGQALRLLADLRRAATPAGALPERVDVRTGVPRSTTPLAWSHAFAILALQELWPSRTASTSTPGRWSS